MTIEASGQFDYPKLRFTRWMARHNLLEHPISGPSEGDLVPAMTARFGRGEPQSKTEIARESFLKKGGYGPISQYQQTVK